jgi:hypothetical protein
MSKTTDTPNFSHGTKDHGTLADSELAAGDWRPYGGRLRRSARIYEPYPYGVAPSALSAASAPPLAGVLAPGD